MRLRPGYWRLLHSPGKVAPYLSGGWSAERLKEVLARPGEWKPFPTASDRAGWEALGAETRQRLVSAGEAQLAGEWAVLPATEALGFARRGNRSVYEAMRNRRRGRLQALAVAECAEGKGRFLDEILNGVWVTVEETFWGVPAHLGMQKAGVGLPDVTEPVVDLFAAETSAELAWVHYLLAPQLDKLSPLVSQRIRTEVERRVLAVNRTRLDFWWMALREDARVPNNWNPWINSNWLTSELLIARDEDGRAAAVNKILRSLDQFLAGYAPDGGCDEGPGYWGRAGASLFDCLEVLSSATGGRVSYWDRPLVKEIGRYICKVHINDEWYVNFADASAKVHLSAPLVYRYGKAVGDPVMMKMGAWAAGGDRTFDGGSLGRQLPALFVEQELRAAPKEQALLRDSWFEGIQVMTARAKAGSAAGLYLAAQGGHNQESHNHNDVGNFIVYSDGKPVVIDVGVETYSAKTFSAQRYDIWTMQSAWHNCPTVDGVMQSPGREFAASNVRYFSDEASAGMEMNIEKAYPASAGIVEWRRGGEAGSGEESGWRFGTGTGWRRLRGRLL